MCLKMTQIIVFFFESLTINVVARDRPVEIFTTLVKPHRIADVSTTLNKLIYSFFRRLDEPRQMLTQTLLSQFCHNRVLI